MIISVDGKITIGQQIIISQGIFLPISASFDGSSDYLTTGAGLTGAVDSTETAVSFWFKVDDAGGDGNLMVFMESDTGSYSIVRNASDEIEVTLKDSSATTLWNFTSTALFNSTTNTGWHNLMFSASLGGVPIISIFLDNVVFPVTTSVGPNGGLIDYTTAGWAIGAATSGANKLTGEIAEFWMHTVSIDFTNPVNRLKFLNTGEGLSPAFVASDGGKPTGSSPCIYLSGDISTWAINKGTCGGFNDNGSIEEGTEPNIPEELESTVNFTKGSLFTWGHDGDQDSGLMGISTTQTNASSPVQVGALTTWTAVSGGVAHSVAIKADNTLWAWGKGSFGRLGQGFGGLSAGRSSPVQVPGGAVWSDASAGAAHTLAIKIDGSLWAWGDTSQGELGNNDTGLNISSPIQIGGDTDWDSVEAGFYTSAAIKSDGTLWTWGNGALGVLGHGNTTNYSIPIQVGALTNWLSIASGGQRLVAVKTDGSLWTWGQDTYRGCLGLGTVSTDVNSPVQIGSDLNWSSVVSNFYYSTLALKNNGTLWGWGYNQFYTQGILGLGDTENKSSPVQVGSDTNWAKMSIGRHHGAAIRTDGTLWTWGNGYQGALGNDIGSGYTSSPVQVGFDANWAVLGRTSGNFGQSRNVVIRDTNG